VPTIVLIPPGGQGQVPAGAPAQFAALLADELAARDDSLTLAVPAGAVAAAAPEAVPLVTEALESGLYAYAAEAGASFALWTVLIPEPEGSLSVRSLVYDVRSRAFAPLPAVHFASNLVGANVAALKLGDALVAALSNFGPPLRAPIDIEHPVPPEVPRAALQPVELPRAPAAVSREVPWWVWAVGAGVAVGAAGTAAALYANRPVTGTVTADW
jgi:hypothetical protein